ncbi:uncharacterized protein VTP21DRAFT_963 [Calcarisporiella thermophila]|uniref:uncharacterized protein n=1 Tax=Calcarisporiella thermophila TaxID=911321 RepID=UPI003743AFC5
MSAYSAYESQFQLDFAMPPAPHNPSPHPIDPLLHCYNAHSLPHSSVMKSFKLQNGASILHRKNVDSSIVLERMQKRREAHSRLERKRRDVINQLLGNLVQAIPKTKDQGEKIHRTVVLQEACGYIKELQEKIADLERENKGLKVENENLRRGSLSPPSSATSFPLSDREESPDYCKHESVDEEHKHLSSSSDISLLLN